MTEKEKRPITNPVDVLKDHPDFIEIEDHRHSDIVYCSEIGFLNVHTGCFISPMIQYKGIFSKEHEPTGDIFVSWGKDKIFTLSGKKVDEFLNKVRGTK